MGMRAWICCVVCLSPWTLCFGQSVLPPYWPGLVEPPPFSLIPGDLNYDCRVDFLDLAVMADHWLFDGRACPADPGCLHANAAKIREQIYQLHYIQIGLEVFRDDYGDYPPSTLGRGFDPNAYVGANVLAEAMVGLDLLGFHPGSQFRSDGLSTIYIADGNVPQEQIKLSLRDRWRYLDLDTANPFRLRDLYMNLGGFNGSSVVLCDVFEATRPTGKRTGMPILYFRSAPGALNQDHTDRMGVEDDFYRYADNEALIKLGTASGTTALHPLGDGQYDLKDFEDLIVDPRITALKWPRRPDSYILISAGPDGLYGTPDDICNFER